VFTALKNKFLGKKKRDSRSLAKSRLHFVLVQDRTGMGSDELANFKKELVAVIDKYFIVDKQGFDIAYEREKETTTLLINSPVVVRRQQGIKHQVGARRSKKRKRARTQAQAAV